MAATLLTPIVAPHPFATAGVAIVFTAIDVANGNCFQSTGREILLINNGDASPHVFTVTSAPDHEGRTGDVSLSIPAAVSIYITQMFPTSGWAVAGLITIPAGQDSHFTLAVIRFPV